MFKEGGFRPLCYFLIVILRPDAALSRGKGLPQRLLEYQQTLLPPEGLHRLVRYPEGAHRLVHVRGALHDLVYVHCQR